MRSRGFTLIELGVALIVVGVLFSAAVVGVGAVTGSRARSALGELGGVVRSLYDTASLTGRTCRLVMELGPEGGSEPFQYRAECAKGAVTRSASSESNGAPGTRPRKEPEEKPLPFPSATDAPSLEDLTAREEQRVEEAAKYAAFTSPEIKPRKMSGVRVSVWTQHDRELQTHGTAYLYFFPQGYVERAQIAFAQGNNAWTLKVAPLTGKTSVVPGVLEVPR
jgi:general secretion pathway protein H